MSDIYSTMQEIFKNLRNLYHKYGRINDSNAKLEEIIKLLCLSYVISKTRDGEKLGLEYVRREANKRFLDDTKIVSTLQALIGELKDNPMLVDMNGKNIFGEHPFMLLEDGEDDFAIKLLREVEKIDLTNICNIDIINECFGHFVRENFRNNKEDAQYMTPLEVANPFLDILFTIMDEDGYFKNQKAQNLLIMDPTCGVGTLLLESAKKYLEEMNAWAWNNDKEKQTFKENFLKHGMIGQDKVARMVALSKLNTVLMGGDIHHITEGNSITGKGLIDEYHEKVDLIFTNPPFGADFKRKEIVFPEYFSYMEEYHEKTTHFPSEVLMLLKCIHLIKEGGYLAIVLPDSVFSSSGIYQETRKILLKHDGVDIDIRMIVKLPSVAFAQAGTRTNTSILVIRKRKDRKGRKEKYIYMGVANDLGFDVREKNGVPVKIKVKGKENDLQKLFGVYKNKEQKDKSRILSYAPSLTRIQKEDLNGDILNPSFYQAGQIAIENPCSEKDSGISHRQLDELVDCVTLQRKSRSIEESGIRHVSVLHILPDGLINFDEVEKFLPVCKGREIHCGDILFSKINPRIPRISVVQEYQKEIQLVCSNEFEILRMKKDVFEKYCIGEHLLVALLKEKQVQEQILGFTSGTSQSHNRIKRDDLLKIRIPIPTTEAMKKEFKKVSEALEKAMNTLYHGTMAKREQEEKIRKLLY